MQSLARGIPVALSIVLAMPAQGGAMPAPSGRITPRTPESRLTDEVNVKDFGAIGNGTTDDTAAVQAALDAASVANTRLFFPAGIYRITSTLTYVRTSTGFALTMEGTSRGRGPTGSVLQWRGPAGGTLMKIQGANSLVISRLLFDGSSLADNLIYFFNDMGANSSSGIHIRDSQFAAGRRTSKSTGIRFGSFNNYQVSEVVIDGCLFQALYYGVLAHYANVKNFTILNSGFSVNFWGVAHGDPDRSVALGGQFIVQACVFSGNGDTAAGFFGAVPGKVDRGGDIYVGDAIVEACESEGSSRFISSSGSVGNNPAPLVLIGNHFELSASVPADDYVVRAAGGLTLIGNVLMNGRAAGAVAKVQAFSIKDRVTNPRAYSQGVVSIGNWYMNAAGRIPLFDGSDNPLADTLTNGTLNRVNVMSFGDVGGVTGNPSTLEEFTGSGSALMASLTRDVSHGLSYGYSGLLSVGVNKVTVPFTAEVFNRASRTVRQLVWDIPARTKITGVVADVTTPFEGLPGTIVMQLGIPTAEESLLLAFDVKTAAVTRGLVAADLGAKLASAAAQGGTYFWATDHVQVRLDSGTGNFGTGTRTNLSAGSVDFYITVERMP
jgi:hypothetical protein